MRTLIPLLGILILTAADPAVGAAQEVGESITLTGCLAQEDDDQEVEYLLENVDQALTMAEEIELIPGEGVSLAEHVGHTVEVTGTVVADDEEDEDTGEEEAEEEPENELHIQVTGLRHISGSCSSDG